MSRIQHFSNGSIIRPIKLKDFRLNFHTWSLKSLQGAHVISFRTLEIQVVYRLSARPEGFFLGWPRKSDPFILTDAPESIMFNYILLIFKELICSFHLSFEFPFILRHIILSLVTFGLPAPSQ